MSKIYDALQRAEQDRIAQQGTAAATATVPAEPPAAAPVPAAAVALPVAPVAAVRQAPAVRQPRPEPLATTPEPKAEFPVPEPATPHPTAAAPTSPAPFLWENIPMRAWKPDLQKLPALERRGIGVEQFRSLRTRLAGFRDLSKLQSILVSSGLPREGKSFTAVNLAVSFARHKSSRVLLIDGDMRRSSLHKVLGCAPTPSLATYLAGNAGMLDVMQRAQGEETGTPLPAGLGSLTFIAGGEEGDKAADLSGSVRFRQLIEAASAYFDWIVVDSSPVNLVTDGVNLAQACDAVLLVTRSGVTKFTTAQRALNELKASKVIGVVLNAAPENNAAPGYYGYDTYDSEPGQN